MNGRRTGMLALVVAALCGVNAAQACELGLSISTACVPVRPAGDHSAVAILTVTRSLDANQQAQGTITITQEGQANRGTVVFWKFETDTWAQLGGSITLDAKNDFPTGQSTSRQFYVQGTAASAAVDDITIRAHWAGSGGTTGDKTVSMTVFSVAITTPAAFPAYAAVNQELIGGLDCTVTPAGISGATYEWTKVSVPGAATFGTSTSKSTSFTASVAEAYTVKIAYTQNGLTASATSGTIYVVSVTVDAYIQGESGRCISSVNGRAAGNPVNVVASGYVKFQGNRI